MGLTNSFKRVLGAGIEDYHAPKVWNICGVRVYFKPEPNGVSAIKWRSVLDEWLPRYEKAGWLDELHRIMIAEGAVDRAGVGMYNMNGSIDLENDVSMPRLESAVIEDTPEYVLAHEMVHHAHLTLNEFDGNRKRPENKMDIKNEVSVYAGKDIGESIAEIGAAIIHGHEFSDWIHEHYETHDGPEEVYDIG